MKALLKGVVTSSIILLITAGLLLALEGFVRLLHPVYEPIVPHPVLNHVFRPNFTWLEDTFAVRGVIPYRSVSNKQGWNETYDVVQQKPAGVYRIFYVGDSFTHGTCATEDAMPKQVEVLLNGFFQETVQRVQVINTGTSSYSPMIYYLQVKKYILDYDPDMVILNVDMTDVFDDYLYAETAVYNPQGELTACLPGSSLKGMYIRTDEGMLRLSLLGKIYYTLLDRSHLVRLVRLYLKPSVKRAKEAGRPQAASTGLPGMWDWCYEPWSAQTRSLVEHSMSYLAKTIRLLRERDVKVVVTGVPHLSHFQEVPGKGRFSTKAFDAIRETTEQAGGIYFDSFTAMQGRVPANEIAAYYIDRDMHFNRSGYRLWAEEQARFLESKRQELFGF